MISEIIDDKEKSGICQLDLPVIVCCKRIDKTVILNEFFENDSGDFAYHGYIIDHNGTCPFTPYVLYDNDIENWTKFKGKVVLSNFAENE